MTHRLSRMAFIMAAVAALAGCAASQRAGQVQHILRQAQDDIRAHLLSPKGDTARRQAQSVDRPWLAGRARPLARDVALPAVLQAQVKTTLMFAGGPVSLPELAERLTLATGLPVLVQPDALLPVERFLPRLDNDTGSVAMTAVNGQSAGIWLDGDPQPLAAMLDRIAARLGISWEFSQGRIVFFRTQTRVFDLRALSMQASADAFIGLSAATTKDGFVSTSGTRLDSGRQDTHAAFRARILPFLTRAGTLAMDPGAGTSVVITDTPDALRRVAAYLEQENRALTRRVRLVFEELTVVLNDDVEAGLDWSLVFSSAAASALLSWEAGARNGAARLEAASVRGPFQGSEGVVQLLQTLGRVVRRNSMPVLTLNRRPVTHAMRTTFSYIDQVQTTALSDGAGLSLPSVSVSQREQTVGSLLTLLPDAQDDGQVMLSVAYDNTVAQPLQSVTFGTKSNPLQLQQITIDGNGTVQQVALRAGQPLLIAGFDRSQDSHDIRRLGPDVPLLFGGSDKISQQRTKTVMVVTAELEEGS